MEAAATWPTPGQAARGRGEAAGADTDGRPARDREGRVRTLRRLRLKRLAATALVSRPRPRRAPHQEEDNRASPPRRARLGTVAAAVAAAASLPSKEAPRTPKK